MGFLPCHGATPINATDGFGITGRHSLEIHSLGPLAGLPHPYICDLFTRFFDLST